MRHDREPGQMPANVRFVPEDISLFDHLASASRNADAEPAITLMKSRRLIRSPRRRASGFDGTVKSSAIAVLRNRTLWAYVLIYVKTRLLGSRRQLFVPKKQDVSKVRLSLRSSNPEALMSALGQKQTLRHLQPMSALPPADIGTQSWN